MKRMQYKSLTVFALTVAAGFGLFWCAPYNFMLWMFPSWESTSFWLIFTFCFVAGIPSGLLRDYLIGEFVGTEFINNFPGSLVHLTLDSLHDAAKVGYKNHNLASLLIDLSMYYATVWVYLIEVPFTLYAYMKVLNRKYKINKQRARSR